MQGVLSCKWFHIQTVTVRSCHARGSVSCKSICHLMQGSWHISCKGFCHLVQEVLGSYARGSVIWCKSICHARVSVISCKRFCHLTQGVLSMQELPSHARVSVMQVVLSCKRYHLMQGVLPISRKRFCLWSSSHLGFMQGVLSLNKVLLTQ